MNQNENRREKEMASGIIDEANSNPKHHKKYSGHDIFFKTLKYIILILVALGALIPIVASSQVRLKRKQSS